MKDLNKILSGNILVQTRNNILTVHQPDASTRYLADFIAEQVYEEAYKQNIYLLEELEELIIENEWWTQDEEDELKQIPKSIMWKDIIVENSEWFDVNENQTYKCLNFCFDNQQMIKAKGKQLMDENRDKFTLNKMTDKLSNIINTFLFNIELYK